MSARNYCGIGLVVLGVAGLLGGCADTGGVKGSAPSMAGATATKSLYERLGASRPLLRSSTNLWRTLPRMGASTTGLPARIFPG